MKVSLKKDLNINKSAIRNNIDQFVHDVGFQDDRIENAMDALTLLQQRGDSYTTDEAKQLISWYITSHDETVWDNEDDFTALQVYTVNKKMDKYDNAVSYIESLK
tara:strand:- start:424 stop:738 length:315 start_codon:yes stop_codon:yes gene_type:complete